MMTSSGADCRRDRLREIFLPWTTRSHQQSLGTEASPIIPRTRCSLQSTALCNRLVFLWSETPDGVPHFSSHRTEIDRQVQNPVHQNVGIKNMGAG